MRDCEQFASNLRAICERLALKGCKCEWFMRRVFVIERV